MLTTIPALPVEVTDPAEKNRVAAAVRASVLATPVLPRGRAVPLTEAELFRELRLDDLLRTSRFATVPDGEDAVAPRYGAAAGIVLVEDAQVTLPEFTHDTFAGAVVSGFHSHFTAAAWPAAAIAAANIPVPGTVEELLAQFEANTERLANGALRAVADVVVPPLFGAQSVTVVIPRRVRVRALALCAGHNKFRPE